MDGRLMSRWGGRFGSGSAGPGRGRMDTFENGRILVSPVSAGGVTPNELMFLR
jgi:hypothetical protein